MDKEKNKRPRLYAVSNAHLDTQWNWTIKDTIRDCIRNTMDYNFALFEKYPAYKINFEGAFRYQLMKEYYPEKYEKVKRYVKSGNWVPVGSTWDAMDVNVPSSEALMRQILYGNNYFEEEFGVVAKDIFLPDCFGFRWALPSIVAHMGLTAFSTQKLVWGVGSPLVKEDGSTIAPEQESDLPRLDLGKWRGPDGNEIFVSLLSGNYTYNFDNDGNEEPLYERKRLWELVQHNKAVSGVAARNLYFGTGDYGGSCSDGSAKLLADAVCKQGEGLFDVLSATPTDIYDDLTGAEKAALPVYEGGLLIPHGYGAMTSHTAMKRLNRQNEVQADLCERISSFAHLLTGNPYPKKRITDAWKHFLWHQFHDDLTGTSIAEAYLYSHNDMVLAQNIFRNEGACGINALASLLDREALSHPMVLYNPSEFCRTEAVKLSVGGMGLRSACDGKGNPVACALDEGGKNLTFVATLPPLSLTLIDLSEKEPTVFETALRLDEHSLENEHLRVVVNENGDICSVYDKTLARELLSAPIREEIYEDNSTVWPSWEYNFDDLMQEPGHPVLAKTELIDLRPVSVGLRITKSYNNSLFVNEVTLDAGSRSLKISAKTDWHEQNSLLLAAFPLSAENETALFDGGLGCVKGGNTNEYPYFIHNVHRFADLSDKSGQYGVTLANDCKYAMTKPDDHTLSVVLIHTPKGNFSPRSGQNFQDHGENVYAFSLTAHSGTKPAIRAAQALNQPILAQTVPVGKGAYSKLSLMEELPEGIEIRAIKQEEKGEGYILRLQECYGFLAKDVTVRFLHCLPKKAFVCDGYERKKEEIAVKNGGLTLEFSPYEVKTLMLQFAPAAAQKAENGRYMELPFDTDLLCTIGQKKENKGVYLPAEQMPTVIESAGISYLTGAGKEKNVLSCRRNVLPLSGAHSRLRLLMASRYGAKDVTLKTGNTAHSITVLPLNEPVGARAMVVGGSGNRSTGREIAHVFTHTKNEDGSDRLYDFAYLFAYDIETAGADTLTLPNDPDILIFAATETDLSAARQLTPFLDGADAKPKKSFRLTANGCKNGSGVYEEGATVLLFAPDVSENGLFCGFEGEGVLFAGDNYALVKMPDHDITVTARYRYLGKDLALGKPCTANHCMHDGESAEKALDGKPFTKWCGVQDENGLCLFTVDLEAPTAVDRVLIGHAGGVESDLWNTADFEVQVKNTEDEDYRTVVSVKDNKENVTVHPLENVKARYVRLYITKPAHDGDRHARIYHFRLYSGEI